MSSRSKKSFERHENLSLFRGQLATLLGVLTACSPVLQSESIRQSPLPSAQLGAATAVENHSTFSGESSPSAKPTSTPSPLTETESGPSVQLGLRLKDLLERRYLFKFRRHKAMPFPNTQTKEMVVETRVRYFCLFYPESEQLIRVVFTLGKKEMVLYDLVDGKLQNERPATTAENSAGIQVTTPEYLEAILNLNGELDSILAPYDVRIFGASKYGDTLKAYVLPFFSSYRSETVRKGSSWTAISQIPVGVPFPLPSNLMSQKIAPSWRLEATGEQNRLRYHNEVLADLGPSELTYYVDGTTVLDAATGLIEHFELKAQIESTPGKRTTPVELEIEKL